MKREGGIKGVSCMMVGGFWMFFSDMEEVGWGFGGSGGIIRRGRHCL